MPRVAAADVSVGSNVAAEDLAEGNRGRSAGARRHLYRRLLPSRLLQQVTHFYCPLNGPYIGGPRF